MDPGKMTGWASWVPGREPVFKAGEAEHFEFLEATYDALSANLFDLVVCEAFIITASTIKKTRGENWSLEQIGAVRWMCHRHHVPFRLRSAGDAKSFSTDEKLKKASMYHRTAAGHANDAARHLLLALVHQQMIDISILA